MRTRLRILAASAGACLLAAGGASVAHAHVTASSDNATAGASAEVSLAVPHGCEGSSTTKVEITIPDGVYSVTPTRNAFYEAATTVEKLPAPVKDAHGNELTERVSRVTYTATTPLPDGQRDVFVLAMGLPADAAGTTLHFPTKQTCEKGSIEWDEVPAEGQNAHDLAHPAPSLAVGEAVSDPHAGHGSDSAHSGHTASDPAARTDALGIAALVVASLGLLTALVALLRGRPVR